MNVHPETLKRLNLDFLTRGPGAHTGIGYTEFIELSMDLWEKIEIEAIIEEAVGPFDDRLGARVKKMDPDDPAHPRFFGGPDVGFSDEKGEARIDTAAARSACRCRVCGAGWNEDHDAVKHVPCDDCHRTDGTHNMEVEH